MAGVRAADVHFYWPKIADLTREVGGTPSVLVGPMTEDLLFRDYARVCLHLGKIPSTSELRKATRELGTRTHIVFAKFGCISEFDRRFLEWLINGPEEFKSIISMPGWQRKGRRTLKAYLSPPPVFASRPFLPAGLQDLEALARGEDLLPDSSDEWANQVFEHRCGDAFRTLGFEVEQSGPGTGAEPDLAVLTRPFNVALARPSGYAVLLDAKLRKGDYVLPTGDRALYECVRNHTFGPKRVGIEKTYLAVIGPGLRETDLEKLAEYLRGSEVRGITLLSAAALMRIVEDSIRKRESFTLAEFEKTLVGTRIVAS
jgi:hypothetical protein